MAEYDMNRTGAYVNEVTLTPGNVSGTKFLWSYDGPNHKGIDGCVFAHPLFVPGVVMGSQKYNVVYIATSTNWVYAYDADSSTLLWSKNLGANLVPPIPPTTPDDADILNCNTAPANSTGPSGIVGTPVILLDSGSNKLWVVTGVQSDPKVTASRKYYLQTIRIGDGTVAINPVLISANGFNPANALQRAELLISNRDSYIDFGFSSYADDPPYQGWVFSYATDSSFQGAMNLSPNANGAGLWMSGGGLASDGDWIYFTTGNNKDNGEILGC